MKILSGHFLVLVISLFSLSACGGGGGGASDNSPPLAPAPAPEISLLVVQSQAYEGNQTSAELTIKRTGGAAALSISYAVAGNSDSSLGSASSADYEILYEDGSTIGSTINLSQNQNSLTIQVRPLVDNQREIPETLMLTLNTGSGYSVSENISAEIIISEATNDRSNSRLFLGTFKAQDGISTSASGLLSFILQGDNDKGTLTYTYANLGTQRTDQHLHLSPSGTIIHDIKDEDLQSSGNVSDYEWDLAPGGIFTTKQQMLDALFNGEFYINVHSADFPGGEIYAP
jgi:hypothetical protein